MGDAKEVTAHFYQGTDGPTIPSQMPTQARIGKLKSICRSLAERKLQHVSLRESRIVDDVHGFQDIFFRLVAGQREMARLVREMERTMTGPVFELPRVSDGWHECAEMLDGLNKSGHQYLNRGTQDEAIILISFQENLRRP
jgi:hypothetical protein